MLYLELDSTYRNRAEFPISSDFQASVEVSASRDRFSTLDPIYDAAIRELWTCPFTTITGTLGSAPAIGAGSLLVVQVAAGAASRASNFYTGAVLVWADGARTRIENWSWLASAGLYDTFRVETVESVTSPIGTAFILEDPSQLAQGLVFIPQSVPGFMNYSTLVLCNEDLNQSAEIVLFDPIARLARIQTTTWSAGQTLTLRTRAPEYYGTVGGMPNLTTIFLNPATPAEKNDLLYLNELDEYRSIFSFNPQTGQCIVSTKYSGTVMPGSKYQLWQWSRDNEKFVDIIGNYGNDIVSFEFELLSLILPNGIVVQSSSTQTAQYPYLYVQLSKDEDPMKQGNETIMSNNPNSSSALFTAVLDKYSPDLPFVRFSGNGMKQTIKFRIGGTFVFRVWLPDGRLLDTQIPETFSPLPPNPANQVSALFSLRQLSGPRG